MGSCQHLDRTTKPSKSAGGWFWSWLTCTWCTSMHQTIPCSELQVSYFALSVIYLKVPSALFGGQRMLCPHTGGKRPDTFKCEICELGVVCNTKNSFQFPILPLNHAVGAMLQMLRPVPYTKMLLQPLQTCSCIFVSVSQGSTTCWGTRGSGRRPSTRLRGC